MNRREFISKTGVGTLGFLLANSLIVCSGENITLEKLLNSPQGKISNFDFIKEGNNYFSYSIMEKGDFQHQDFNAMKAFVFCENEKIVGFTLQIKGSNDTLNFIEELSKKYSNKKKLFENEFGLEYKWESKHKNITLCFTKEYKNLPQYCFYSEYLPENKLIVF